MEKSFWLDRWEQNEIGFHASVTNPLLVEFLPELNLAPGARLLLPLCGKTLDIRWLIKKGFKVVGVELSETAIKQLFLDLEIEPTISETDELKHYKAANIDIYVGDFFATSAELLGPIDAVYDRAAFIALPPSMRKQYCTHLAKVTHHAPQLLITVVYDQSLADGPPFSLTQEEVAQHYEEQFAITQLEKLKIIGGLKKKWPAVEEVYALKPLSAD